MAVSENLRRFLSDRQAQYRVVQHPRTFSASHTAQAAKISAKQLAKAVLLKSRSDYLVAVVPASSHVKMRHLRRCLQDRVRVAKEQEIPSIFKDCDPGAIPALGTAYGLETLVDEQLNREADVYFEAGDHESLVHMSGAEFRRVTADMLHADVGVQNWKAL
ncbi:aminoacyl-tRNA deacylase [Aestuariispira insulae]|uniref:Ala-tRNA(Pro) deacylase n=1 Tax=Aestuariispira insulae TaxID=1461337 RepID=A0A3D9HWH6_9PROT|nr:YbaK/EbsC family protein [Aestuariispira insulae]RED53827.1 Ala-tRNA(Pro) deacylase [Aestuariispira insulae]